MQLLFVVIPNTHNNYNDFGYLAVSKKPPINYVDCAKVYDRR